MQNIRTGTESESENVTPTTSAVWRRLRCLHSSAHLCKCNVPTWRRADCTFVNRLFIIYVTLFLWNLFFNFMEFIFSNTPLLLFFDLSQSFDINRPDGSWHRRLPRRPRDQHGHPLRLGNLHAPHRASWKVSVVSLLVYCPRSAQYVTKVLFSASVTQQNDRRLALWRFCSSTKCDWDNRNPRGYRGSVHRRGWRSLFSRFSPDWGYFELQCVWGSLV